MTGHERGELKDVIDYLRDRMVRATPVAGSGRVRGRIRQAERSVSQRGGDAGGTDGEERVTMAGGIYTQTTIQGDPSIRIDPYERRGIGVYVEDGIGNGLQLIVEDEETARRLMLALRDELAKRNRERAQRMENAAVTAAAR